MKSFKFGLLTAALSFALFSCGGGSSDSGGGQGKDASPNDYVTGSFKSKVTEGFSFNWFSRSMAVCDDNMGDKYFESNNVIVLGEDSFPDEDYQYAATLVQNNFDTALSQMGYSRSAYESVKNGINPQYLEALETALVTLAYNFSEEYFADKPLTKAIIIGDFSTVEQAYPHYFDGHDVVLQTSLAVKDFFATKTFEEFQEIYPSLLNEHGYEAEPVEKMNDKIIVCLDGSRSEMTWGEGALEGMIIAPKSYANRSDAADLVLHELIHHVQIAFTSNTLGYSVLERWFAEGQAVYLSGMNITTGNHGRNPTEVISHIEEQFHYSDFGLAYEDYGQAYKYIEDSYGKDSIKNMFEDLKNNKQHESTSIEQNLELHEIYYYPFKEKFSKHITDLEQFRLDYPSLSK